MVPWVHGGSMYNVNLAEWTYTGELAQMVERSLSMGEARGSMPRFSTDLDKLVFAAELILFGTRHGLTRLRSYAMLIWCVGLFHPRGLGSDCCTLCNNPRGFCKRYRTLQRSCLSSFAVLVMSKALA